MTWSYSDIKRGIEGGEREGLRNVEGGERELKRSIEGGEKEA